MAAGATLPLFPLPLVLFPGAGLPLRIFESRYLEMVRECARDDTGFGVVRIDDADGEPVRHAVVGTEARIRDFSTLDDGLLGIDCTGHRRFRVRATRARDNGLIVADVEWLAAEAPRPVPARYAALQTMLREILRHREFRDVIDADPDEAVSLGMALSSVLPLESTQAQVLLEFTEPLARLEHLVGILQHLPDDE